MNVKAVPCFQVREVSTYLAQDTPVRGATCRKRIGQTIHNFNSEAEALSWRKQRIVELLKEGWQSTNDQQLDYPLGNTLRINFYSGPIPQTI